MEQVELCVGYEFDDIGDGKEIDRGTNIDISREILREKIDHCRGAADMSEC